MDPLDEYNKMPDWNGDPQMRCAYNRSYYYPTQFTNSADPLKAHDIYNPKNHRKTLAKLSKRTFYGVLGKIFYISFSVLCHS